MSFIYPPISCVKNEDITMTQPHPPSGALTFGSILALLLDPFSVLEDIGGIVLCPSTLSEIMALHVLPPFSILDLDDDASIMALRIDPWPRFD